jgi:hypothetical protein
MNKEYKYKNNYYNEDDLIEIWLKDKHNQYYDVTYGRGYRVQLIELTEQKVKEIYKTFNSRCIEFKGNDKRYYYKSIDKLDIKDIKQIYLTETRGIQGNIASAMRIKIKDDKIVALKF